MEIQLAILITQALLRYGPALARELALLFSKKEITLEDWDKVFALAEKPYDSYVGEVTVTAAGADSKN
jgi:hypothetical protein